MTAWAAIFAAAAVLFYALFKRRTVDFYALAILSSLFYFSPLFFGYVWLHDKGSDVINPITERMAGIYLMVFASLFLGMLFNDGLMLSKRSRNELRSVGYQNIFYYLALVFWLLFAMVHSQDLLHARKENFGSIYSVAFTAVVFALVLSLLAKDYKWSFVFLMAAVIDLYAGNREIIAFTFLSVFVVLTSRLGSIRLSRYYVAIAALVLGVMLLAVYKMIGAAIVVNRWDLVVDRLTTPQFYSFAIMRAEPFVTQSILYEATEQEWAFNGSIALNIAQVLMPLSSLFDSEIVSVSSIVNQKIGDIGYGVASNIWAEAYMLGGGLSVVVFAILYALLPMVANVCFFKYRSLPSQTLIALLAVVLLFFIHRAGLEYSFNIFKRYVLYFAFVVALGSLLVGRGRA